MSAYRSRLGQRQNALTKAQLLVAQARHTTVCHRIRAGLTAQPSLFNMLYSTMLSQEHICRGQDSKGSEPIVDPLVAKLVICADCKYSRPGADPKFPEHWVCTAEEGEILRPAGRDSVTGETYFELRKSVRCLSKNFNGDCADFDQKPPTMVPIEPKRGLLRTWMLKLGAWLIAKGS